jgi:hypothetical protein
LVSSRSNGFFSARIDILGTTYLWGVGIPVLLFVILFTTLFIKGWTPTSGIDYVGIFVGLVLTMLISVALILSVNTHGWAKEKIRSDTLKISADGKYEYRVDLINLFQKNSHARLYLKDISTGHEEYIPTDIQTRKIKTLAVGGVNHWVKLEPMDNTSYYILSTTTELRIPEENFMINVSTGTLSRLK